MRVLVACEYSGRVRDAFIKLGHDAVSCDFRPSDTKGPHYQGDVTDILQDGWDLMIAHPPCTYLCRSGLHWNSRTKGRNEKTEQALAFVQLLMNYPFIPKIALENPVGCISTRIRKPEQVIQPWQFGHPESKETCLWLKGLPKLVHTKVLPLPEKGYWDNQTATGQNNSWMDQDRFRVRSITYLGLAKAMAEQWGGKIVDKKRKKRELV